MLNSGYRPAVTSLREELVTCLAERDSRPVLEDSSGEEIRPEEASVVLVKEFIGGNGEMSALSPLDLINFARYCDLDFHRMLFLAVKAEWQWFVSKRLPPDKSIESLMDEGLSAVRELSSGFNLAMSGNRSESGLFNLFESCGGLATGNGYDEKDLRDFVRHMILADIHLFAAGSPEFANFIEAEEEQRKLLKGASSEAVDEFWKKKRIWIELQNEVEGLLLTLEEQTLRNRRTQRDWMSVFGQIYIPLLESEYLYNSLTFRISRKTDEPGLTLEELDAMEEEDRQAQKEHIAALKKNATSIRKNLPGGGGIPLDFDEMEEYEKECKKLLRKIWRLTHPDSIEQEKFTPEQKKKLRAFFEEAVPYQESGSLDDSEIALSMRSLMALKDLLARVEAVWNSMGLDCNEQTVIRGETLEEQSSWLDSRIRELEEEAAQVRVDLMAAANDPEYREMEACLTSREQIAKISEELDSKRIWYEEQNLILEQRLAELFGG